MGGREGGWREGFNTRTLMSERGIPGLAAARLPRRASTGMMKKYSLYEGDTIQHKVLDGDARDGVGALHSRSSRFTVYMLAGIHADMPQTPPAGLKGRRERRF